MELSTSVEEIPRSLSNPKIQSCVHRIPPLYLILGQFTTVHVLTFCLLKIHFNIIPYLHLGLARSHIQIFSFSTIVMNHIHSIFHSKAAQCMLWFHEFHFVMDMQRKINGALKFELVIRFKGGMSSSRFVVNVLWTLCAKMTVINWLIFLFILPFTHSKIVTKRYRMLARRWHIQLVKIFSVYKEPEDSSQRKKKLHTPTCIKSILISFLHLRIGLQGISFLEVLPSKTLNEIIISSIRVTYIYMYIYVLLSFNLPRFNHLNIVLLGTAYKLRSSPMLSFPQSLQLTLKIFL